MMQQYLVRRGIPQGDIFAESAVWGSRAEIREAIRVILENKKEFMHRVPPILHRAIDEQGFFCMDAVVVSSIYHIPRLRLICFQELRKVGKGPITHWRWQFAWCRGELGNALWEFVKLPLEFLR